MHLLHALLVAFVCGLTALPLVANAAKPADLPEHTLRDGLPRTAARLADGQELRIAYLGGSITAANGYRPQTTAWLRSQHPSATITEIKAAVPGTGSTLGAFRLRREVLEHRPNLLLVEFAVNDNGVPADRVIRGMEGIVRQTLTADPSTEVVFVYTVMESYLPAVQRGELPPAMQAMERVAEHYGLPTVLMGKTAVAQIAAGEMLVRPAKDATGEATSKPVFSDDGVHPRGDTGHRLYSEALQRFFTAAIAKPADEVAETLEPPPLDANNYEHARLLPLGTAQLDGDWSELPREHEAWREYAKELPSIRVARSADDLLTLRFVVPPQTRGVVGAADLTGPGSGHLLVSLDGGAEKLVERFNSYSYRYKRRFVVFADNLAPGEHVLYVRPSPEPIHKAGILAKSNVRIDDLARFEGLAWFVSDLMLIGEPVRE